MNTTLASHPTKIEARDLSTEGRERRLFVAWLRDVYKSKEAQAAYPNLDLRRRQFIYKIRKALSNYPPPLPHPANCNDPDGNERLIGMSSHYPLLPETIEKISK